MKQDFEEVISSPTRAYEEGLRFFEGEGMLNDTLKRLIADLETHNIDYNVIGGVALNQHGYQRFTHDIDLLLSPDGLEIFRSELMGRGYRPAFGGALKTFRATERNVPIEVITTGEYPGDGKPKPVQFHDPREHFTVIDGVKTVTLPKLIELKLASGMSSPGRLRDLADVQELIRIKQLDATMVDNLDPSVREKYLELYEGVVQDLSQTNPFIEDAPKQN
ncbi:MAG TPA: hypothetical protein VKU00_07765 [Chthonomonadaceae bacterium]|nr:hypothetical protein [Chthonomonadaceae bacterium]